MQYCFQLSARLRKRAGLALCTVVFLGAMAAPATELLPGFPSIEKHRVETGEEVHQWLTREAWRYFSSQIVGAELDNFIGVWGVDGVYIDARQSTVLDGSRDEDKGQKPPLWQGMVDVFFDLDSPSMRHFCASAKDMYKGLFIAKQFDSNMTQAQNIWQDNASDNMLLRHGQADKATVYYYLGHVAHLVQDLTVPAHTHNDPHGSSLVALHDSYEQDYAATHFREYRYDNAVGPQYVLKNTPITIPASLYEAFQQTAEYTDDYDSNHADGEYAKSGLAACFFPDDYPSALLHRPADALRTGGGETSTIPGAKCAIIADDLMYWAIKRTAQLFRFFYREVDTEPFHAEIRLADQDIDLSSDETAPTPYWGPRKALLHVSYSTHANTDFPASGIVKDSCVLHYAFKPDGAGWFGEQTIPFPQGAGPIALPTYAGTYRVWVTAENGAGNAAQPVYGYFHAPGFALLQPPTGGRVAYGGTFSLNVKVSGANDQSAYAWQKDDRPIPGADSDTYTVANAGFGDTGRYRCTVTDPAQGSINTPAAAVEVVQGLPAAQTPALTVEIAFLLVLGALSIAGNTRRRPRRAKG